MPYFEKPSQMSLTNSYSILSKQISSNNLLTNNDNNFYSETNTSYSKSITDNNSEKSNLSTFTSGNPNEKSVRFLDNETHDNSSPDSNI